MAASEAAVYFVVNNIPVRFRSADLRNYFSQFIESKGFHCFHYRHRPEVRVQTAGFKTTDAGSSERTDDGSEGKHEGSCCCVVSVRSESSDRFMKMYSGNQWIDSTGSWLGRKCLIRRVRVSDQTGEYTRKTTLVFGSVPWYFFRYSGRIKVLSVNDFMFLLLYYYYVSPLFQRF